ncbi:MAG: DUF11 domain-containing protein [Parasphingorhabdus sp.]|uniref:DUF11 domain-containing protein n=1 Tax=Parasphingorhabdus sp. TaxID=2709688 RepID=UPI003297B329
MNRGLEIQQESRKQWQTAKVRAWLLVLLLGFVYILPGTAYAQTVNQYTNSTDSAAGEISGADSCTVGITFQRDIFVSDDFSVQDVNVGVLMSHDTRSEFALFLRSPAGSIVTMKNLVGGTADNFNVLLDDDTATSVDTHTANDTATAGTVVPPYQRTFSPSNSVDAVFTGQGSFGTWTLFVCDFVDNGVNGTFFQMDLFLETPPPSADLSLAKTVASSSPSSAVYTLSVTNSAGSDLSATGVTVRDILPAGVTFVSASGTGSFNSGTGIWTLGTDIAPGQTMSIDLSVNVTATAGSTITNTAEILTASPTDPDSTPGNGVTTEDDFASRSFTVGGRLPGIPPNIGGICAAAGSGTILLDWNNHSWTSGSTTGSATLANLGTVNFAVATEGVFSVPLNLTIDNSGGFGSAGLSLYQNIEYATRDEVTTTIVTLPTAVPGAQFTVFDVDFAANDFADKLTVTGTFNGGAPFNATLTNGVVNFNLGNDIVGDGLSGGTSDDGNVVATFAQPVDTITITYGNHTTAPNDPMGQAISIYDFTFCTPATTLSVTKLSSVLNDPVNGNTDPKSIPGATIQYCILISNAGSATASTISATDTLPANVTFVAASMQSGSNCGSAATAEDDDATGADENDPFGASFSGGTLTATAASLGPAEGYALTFQVTVD